MQGREYRIDLDDRSMRKIKAAEAETTAPVDDMAGDDDGEQTAEVANNDGTVQTPFDLVGQQGCLTPAVSFCDLA